MEEPKDSLIDYPCDFPIKVMGVAQEGFQEAICAVVAQYDPEFTPEKITTRPSSKGNFLAITVTLRALNREQLDTVYRALSGLPMVKMVL